MSERALLPEWFFRVVPRLGAFAIAIIGLLIAAPAVILLVKRYAA